jgi:hypothetical protein
MAIDNFASETPGLEAPAIDAFAVSPSDTVLFATVARKLWVGGAGNVSLVTKAGNTVVFTAVPAGSLLPVGTLRVNATGTTSTNIVGLV